MTNAKTTLTTRVTQLQHLHARLAKHHFGIDKEIQHLLDAFMPWHLFAGTAGVSTGSASDLHMATECVAPATFGRWGCCFP